MRIFALLVLTGLSACTAPNTTLINDAGRRAHCGYWGAGGIGRGYALATGQDCVDASLAAGFHIPGDWRRNVDAAQVKKD
jgi:hypothetical protein